MTPPSHLPAPGEPAAPSPPRGLFVAVEGGDGAGKSTQLGRLVAFLRERGTPHLVTREPGGTPLGAAIREVVLHGDAVTPRAEALLFAADRAQHVATLVEPALASGRTVVTDRFADSSIAYQSAGRDLSQEDVAGLSAWASGGLRPDLTILLDVSPELGRARRGDVHDRLESEGDDFHARVRARFLDLAAAHADRYLVLDAGGDVDELAAAIRERVGALLDARGAS